MKSPILVGKHSGTFPIFLDEKGLYFLSEGLHFIVDVL
jgi:hypothetical protein